MIRKNAFSLLEIMVVIAIIGFIAGIVVVNVMGQQDAAAVKATKFTIVEIEKAVDLYRSANNKFPEGTNGLQMLVQEKLIKKYKDAWNNDLQYQYPGTNGRTYDVWSLGRDGLDGGEEFDKDIYNGESDTDG
jgi:general secretion pathway protein G